MPVLSFNKKFVPAIECGKKRQTIRAFRKYPIKPGDKLYLYTALRTKHSRKLGEGVCKAVYPILGRNESMVAKGPWLAI